ncbi:MAG: 30S ribosomal protein S20 [Polyangiaceae bacterium]|nr:30S ribosomal protein S20 [Polyangiaceae bacterium]
MANHPSAEKRNRQRIVTTLRNRSATSAVRTAVRNARKAIAEGDRKAAELVVAATAKLVAKAAGKGAIRVQTASRTISRIQIALNKLA